MVFISSGLSKYIISTIFLELLHNKHHLQRGVNCTYVYNIMPLALFGCDESQDIMCQRMSSSARKGTIVNTVQWWSSWRGELCCEQRGASPAQYLQVPNRLASQAVQVRWGRSKPLSEPQSGCVPRPPGWALLRAGNKDACHLSAVKPTYRTMQERGLGSC